MPHKIVIQQNTKHRNEGILGHPGTSQHTSYLQANERA